MSNHNRFLSYRLPNAAKTPHAAMLLGLVLAAASAQPMSGTYPVGPGGPGVDSFATVQDAANAVSARGLGGNVLFAVAPGTYDGPVTLRSITGSSTHECRFQSVHTGTIIDARGGPYAFRVESTENVVLQRLSLQGARGSGSVCVRLANSDNCQIRSCQMGDSAETGVLAENAGSLAVESLLVEGQLSGSSSRGVDLRGCRSASVAVSSLNAALGTGLSVHGGSDNLASQLSVTNAAQRAVELDSSPHFTLSQCAVSGAPVSGIYARSSPGSQFNNCRMDGAIREQVYVVSSDSLSINTMMLSGNSERALTLSRSNGVSIQRLTVQSEPAVGVLLDHSAGCSFDQIQMVGLNRDTATGLRLDSSGGGRIQYCQVIGNYRTGISIERSSNLKIMHARLYGTAAKDAIYLGQSDGVMIELCSLRCSAGRAGVFVSEGQDDTLSRITAVGAAPSGIRTVSGTRDLVVANCFLQNWTESGLSLDQAESTRIYYTTIVGPKDSAAGFHLVNSHGVTAKDDIVWNTGQHGSSCVRIEGRFPFAVTDFNDLYASDSFGSVARVNDTFYLDLASWQARDSALDRHSLSRDPLFRYTDDFHLGAQSPCRHRGTPVPGIAFDYDGDSRDPTAPDIGADECQLGAVNERRLEETNNELRSADSSFVIYARTPATDRIFVHYYVPVQAEVGLQLFDRAGRSILLAPQVSLPAGMHTASLDASRLPRGVCFVRLRTGAWTRTRKLVLN